MISTIITGSQISSSSPNGLPSGRYYSGGLRGLFDSGGTSEVHKWYLRGPYGAENETGDRVMIRSSETPFRWT